MKKSIVGHPYFFDVEEFFAKQGVNVMEWPARSPELNLIENVWAIMSREVHRNGKQYDSVSALTSAVI